MTQELNPYRPPAADVELAGTAAADAQRAVAGKGRRFATLLVDYLGAYLFAVLVGVGVFLVFGRSGIARLHQIPDLLLGTLLFLTYYLLFEGLWQRTPGKLLLGTVVVDMAGARPSFRTIVKRTFSRFIPFEAFSFLGARGWHDSISQTQVVRTR